MSAPSDKPISEACLRNSQPIGDMLAAELSDTPLDVLELGSGTGQHAVYLARRFPQSRWQTSDLHAAIAGIQAWVRDAQLVNLPEPAALDVREGIRPEWIGRFDRVFTANTLHFMSIDAAGQLMAVAAQALKRTGKFWIYGPFNENGCFTSPGNKALDDWLKQGDPHRGIRDLEWVLESATACGFDFSQRIDMPANNLMLEFIV